MVVGSGGFELAAGMRWSRYGEEKFVGRERKVRGGVARRAITLESGNECLWSAAASAARRRLGFEGQRSSNHGDRDEKRRRAALAAALQITLRTS